MQRTIARRVTAEAVGTCLLLAAVVGSGIMGEKLAAGNVAIALLANTLATGAALVALILTFGPISGAHFNPAVTLADASQRGLPWKECPGYLGAQFAGAFVGVGSSESHVREAAVLRLTACSPRQRTALERIHRNIRIAIGDLGLRAHEVNRCPICRRRLYHGCILVHRLHFIRQSRCDDGPRGKRHVCRNSISRRARICHRPIFGGCVCYGPVSMANSQSPSGC